MTGLSITHDTNITMFQLLTKKENEELPSLSEQTNTFQAESNELTSAGCEIPPFNIRKHVGPPLFKNFSEPVKDLIEKNFLYDIAWSIAGAVPSNFERLYLPLIGSWTSFKKLTSSVDIETFCQEYLAVIPSPPEYPVCKNYLHNSHNLISYLEISHIYVHADEMVYSKLCNITWKKPKLYKCIVILMGGLHQLCVKQRLIFKCFICIGIKDWCVDAGVIAPSSAAQAAEGSHYYRYMCLHKECFNAIVQF